MGLSNLLNGIRKPGTVGFPLPGVKAKNKGGWNFIN